MQLQFVTDPALQKQGIKVDAHGYYFMLLDFPI
jgi:hypothetical protein